MEDKVIEGVNLVIDCYFKQHPNEDIVRAKDLMNNFIQARIYNKNHRDGLEIRNDLRDLDKAGKLHLIPSIVAERKTQNTNWFFRRIVNFKGEPFINTSKSIYGTLTEIANRLEEQIQNADESKIVSEVVEQIRKKKNFQEIWRKEPNNVRTKNPKMEFKGIYLFAEKTDTEYKPVYVGISQTIGRRFRGHTMGGRKQYATWAYMMAKFEHTHAKGGRYDKMVSVPVELEMKWIREKQKWINGLRFTFLLMEDNTLMHLAEVFCSAHLKCKWNTFETH